MWQFAKNFVFNELVLEPKRLAAQVIVEAECTLIAYKELGGKKGGNDGQHRCSNGLYR